VLCLLGNGDCPQILPARVPPQDLYFRADRERTHKLPLTLLQGVYPSPLPIRDLHVSNYLQMTVIFELLLSLPHNLFPLLLKTPSRCFASPLPLRGTRAVFLLYKQFPCELKTEVEAISWHSESYWVDSHRARAWSSATWSRALRRCIRSSCKHQVIPYSSAAKRYSRCSVASAGLPCLTLFRRQLFPRPTAVIEYSASKWDHNRWIYFFSFSVAHLIINFRAK
jgi:hypothetical protein